MGNYDGAPLIMGSAYGTRSWAVDRLGRLSSPVIEGFIWQPGVNVANTDRDHYSYSSDAHGFKNGSWGFYAFRDGYDELASGNRISGVIEMTGMVQIGTKGYRAEKAKIVALLVPLKDPLRVKPIRWMQNWWHFHDLTAFWLGVVASLYTIAATIMMIINLRPPMGNDIDRPPADHTGAQQWILSTVIPLLYVLFSFYVTLWTSKWEARPKDGHYERGITRIAQNYPDAQIFRSRKQMNKAFTLDNKFESLDSITPDDPDFWKMEIKV